MPSKILIQISIILVIMLILFISYFFLFNKNEIVGEKNNQNLNKEYENKIVDLEYTANDKQGNTYIIKSDFGEISENDKNILKLENVRAVIKLNKANEIYIFSKFADYNKVTLDTYFFDEVRLKYDDHNIQSKEIFLNYTNKDVKIQKDVIYEGYNNKLLADIVEIDLVTKFSKIYMLEKTNNVKVEIKKMAIIKKFRIKSFKKNEPLLELKNISKSFGERKILDNVSLKINRGEILGLLGPNGAGKSTIFNLITGLLKPDYGKVIFGTKEANDFPIYLRTQKFKIGYVPQYGGYFSDLTTYENLKAVAQILIKDTREQNSKIEYLISKFELDYVRNIKSTFLSGGQKKTCYSYSSFRRS